MRKVVGLLVSLFVLVPVAPVFAAEATATTTTISVSPRPKAGEPVTAVVTVAATPGAPAPTGSVAVNAGTTSLSSTVTAGSATVTIPKLRAGVVTLTAAYSGDASNAASTGTLTLDVASAAPAPKVRLAASSKKASVGDLVTLRWTSSHATKVKASGAWKGKRKARGTAKVRVTERGKNVFVLKATGPGGTTSTRVSVMVARKAKSFPLEVTDALVLPGAKVAVSADGLAAGETWTLRLAGTVLLKGEANPRGQVKHTVVVPKGAAEGALPLTLTGSNPDRTGTGVLNVIRARTLPVELESDEVTQGGTQTLSLEGLAAGEEVAVSYKGAQIAVGKADADGRFMYTFEVGGKKGERTVSVVGAVPGRHGEASFTVKAEEIEAGRSAVG